LLLSFPVPVRRDLPVLTNTAKPDLGKGPGLHYSRFGRLHEGISR
jgi:hypothetical protein